MAEYQLSAELLAHENDVRAVAFPTPDIIASGSRDGTVRLWRRTSGTPTAFQPSTIASSPKQYFNSVAVLPRKSEDGTFHNRVMYAGTDLIIEVRDVENVGNDHRQLFGHEANICALDASPSGSYIVSGSWDSRCIVWENYEAARLLDHDTGGPPRSVWAVLAYDDNTVITGSADTNIRIFNLRASRQQNAKRSAAAQGFSTVAAHTTIKTPDVVRALCRFSTELTKRHPSNADFASAGNDGVIRLWKSTGTGVDEKGQLHGHDSFIYSLAVTEYGDLVSSGEDRTVRIWKGMTCVQTITHPAISVWSVAVGPNNDIVSGASDGVVRVFTRNESRRADAEALASFEKSVQSSSIPAPAMDRKNIPPKAWLDTNRGQKPGQIKTVLGDDDSILAYQWDAAEWKLVGTVVEPPTTKVSHNGQEYDFVWDVDIGPEQPMLKLPFNRGEDVYAAARKFLEENSLPISYFEAVAGFINDNLGNQQGFAQGDANPNDTQPKQKPYKWNALLPHTKYLHLVQSKLALGLNKLREFNGTVSKAVQLNPRQLDHLGLLANELTASPEEAIIDSDVKHSVITVVTQWPYDKRLPGLDFLRCIAVKEGGAKYKSGNVLEAAVTGALNLVKDDETPELASIDMIKDVAWNQVNANNVMMALRVAANLFATNEGREIMTKESGPVISLLAHIAGVDRAKTPFGETNANLQGALITVAFNYAALAYNERQKSPRETNVSTPMLETLLAVARKVATTQDSREFQFRAGMVAGNIAAIGGAELNLVRGASVTDWLEAVGKQGEEMDQRIWSVLEEIDTRLRGQ